MGAWAALRQFLDKREPVLALMDDPFIQLDKEIASRGLKLRERGAEQGKLDLPPAEMATLDNVEMDVIAHVNEHYARAQVDAANSIRSYDGRLAELALLVHLSSISAEAKKAVSNFKTEVATRANILSNSKDEIRGSYEELKDFREEHKLFRPAHPVPPKFATYGAIAVAWLVETAVNAIFLRLNDENGLLGGVLAAAAVSAVNVFLAAFIGRLIWPRTNLRNDLAKVSAWLVIVGWAVIVIVWNLLAAHYRDAKSLGLPDPEKRALSMMGVGLDSIYSWGLLGAGILFAILSAISAYKMDDPYPGYGEVSRRHNQRGDDYAAELQDSMEQLTAMRDEALEGAISVQRELSQEIAERNQILAARSAFCRRYEEFGAQLEQVANGLLQDYRIANRSTRSTQAPSHFNDRWSLQRAPLPPPGTSEVGEAQVKAAEAALEKAVRDITLAYDHAVGRLEPLEALKQRLSGG
jgi:hypothetical protein